mmetsp:Transcript_39048/g.59494  ORF Transcript_39048/g.59494 Transcript_39048/m.59494 type:complete len:123 (-) Transcript_39048:689-1057(-)|eukprot:CAMPEP_0170482052 /NCGR_PEP_ID=MMETSP0208-20121228/2242_1 /TAXON_ID=197538 /ORGANISM="Strombidium inclinatum, Strain S3" /LENGTH=122 /DNA_ID=CAMNT_0010754847 /DNA_START=1789 /DNA_END=2157 /DNA_ORIENTATION=+
MSFKLSPEPTRKQSNQTTSKLGQSAEFNNTNSSKPRVGTQELSELERELDDMQGKKLKSKEAIDIVKNFENEEENKKNVDHIEPPATEGPVEPSQDLAEPPKDTIIKEIKESPSEEYEQINA